MAKNYCNIIFKKKDGKLTPMDFGQRALLKEFTSSLEEEELVEVFIETKGLERTKLQLAKIHAAIGELAKESGYTFEEMKNLIKVRTSLVINDNGKEYLKSFADCDRETLSEVIKNIESIAIDLNINLKGKMITFGN